MVISNSLYNEPLENHKDRIEYFEKVLANINDENVYLKDLFKQYTQELTELTSAKG